MDFTRDVSMVQLKLESFAVKKKKKNSIHFTINDIEFRPTSQYDDETQLISDFFAKKTILCSKMFENTAWSECEETKKYSIMLLPGEWVYIIQL